jgi:hypothetical protein
MSETEDVVRADVRRILDENPAFARTLQQFMALYAAAEYRRGWDEALAAYDTDNA